MDFTSALRMPTLGSRMISQISATATAEITIGMKMIMRKNVDPSGMPAVEDGREHRADADLQQDRAEHDDDVVAERHPEDRIARRLGVVSEADEVPVLRGQPEGIERADDGERRGDEDEDGAEEQRRREQDAPSRRGPTSACPARGAGR